MMKCLDEFFKMLFSKKENIEPTIEEPIEIEEEEEVVLETPKVIEPQYPNIKILIDNGHGNNTGGKRSPYSLCKVKPAIDYYEYKWNREIAKPIVDGLKELDYNADLLVTEDIDISLTERANRVNKVCAEYGSGNVILISVHANAAGNGQKWMTAKGWSAFTTRGNTKSDKLAEFLYDAATVNFPDRKIRTDKSDGDRDWETNFYICLHSKCPAVLTENFFYDNTDDVQYILSDEGREAVIKTHIDGITNYIKDTF
jgi:N-acetylmuramoyl-L-alanine amidase